MRALIELVSLALLEAVSAVDWSSLGRLEWHFTLFAAFRTDGLVHFAWAKVVSPSVVVTH